METVERRQQRVSRAYYRQALESVAGNGVRLFSLYDEVCAILQDTSSFVREPSAAGTDPAIQALFARWLVFRNDAARLPLRCLLAKALLQTTDGAVEHALSTYIGSLVARLADERQVDVLADFAVPISHRCMSLASGLAPYRVVELLHAGAIIDEAIGGRVEPAGLGHALELLHAAARDSLFFRSLADSYPDVEEATGNIAMLLYGFFGPLAAALGNLVVAMAIAPDWRNCRDQHRWIAEATRLLSPTLCIDRRATRTTRVGRQTVQKNERVGCLVVAANRDSSLFIRPHELDGERCNANRHLSFGLGGHTCMARFFFEIAATTLLRTVMHDGRVVELCDTAVGWSGNSNAFAPASALVRLRNSASFPALR